MPNINLITPQYYSSDQPYHKDFDNLPLKTLVERENLINSAVDSMNLVLVAAQGTQGTLANRLNQSTDQNGDLLATAVDDALHNIGAHADGTYNGLEYVRMLADERSKLSNIAVDASALRLNVQTPSNIVEFVNETVILEPSNSVSWSVTSPNIIKANLAFPATAAHQHYYDVIPTPANQAHPDYTNYKTPVAFVAGSLRVFINGIRVPISQGSPVSATYVYNAAVGPAGAWTLIRFTAVASAGTFALSRAISSTDFISVDFDISLV